LQLFFLLVILIVIVMSVSRGINIGLTLIISGIMFLILIGRVEQLPDFFMAVIFSFDTWNIIIAVNFILLLSIILEEKGIFKRIIYNLKGLIPYPWLLLTVIPAFVGFMPGPGVIALASPLVAEVAEGHQLKKKDMALITFWFRIAVLIFTPLSFAFFITIGIFDVNPLKFLFSLIPFGIIFSILGYLTIIKPLHLEKKQKLNRDVSRVEKSIELLKDCLFLIFIMGLVLSGVAISISTGLVLIYELIVIKMGLKEIKDILRKLSLNLTLVIFGIFVFKEIISGIGVIEKLMLTMVNAGISQNITVIVLPAVVAFVTGSQIATIGIVLSVFSTSYSGVLQLAVVYTLVRLSCAASPINDSHAVTAGYFQLPAMDFAKRIGTLLLPAIIGLIILGLLLF